MRKSFEAEVTLVEPGDGSAYLEFLQARYNGKRRFASAAVFDPATLSALKSALVVMEAANA